MTPTRDQVRKVASLARLELSAEEEVTLGGRLGAILEAFATLAALDTSGVQPTAHAGPLGDDAQREDEVLASLPPSKSLANAPATVGTSFAVPKILE